MNDEAMKAGDREPNYRKAMLFHSDRADQYAAERDAAIARAEAAETALAADRAPDLGEREAALREAAQCAIDNQDCSPWEVSEAILALIGQKPDEPRQEMETALAAAEAKVEKLREALADLTAAFAKKVDVNSTRWRMPYEHPLSAYDRAMDLLAASITEADNA